VDIFPKNGLYTWNNKRGRDRQISSRVYPFVITKAILLEGVTVESDIIPCGGFDHWRITMDIAILGTPKNRPFKFEKFCLSHPYLTSKIKHWWHELLDTRGTKMYQFQAQLKHLKAWLRSWNEEVFGDIFKDKKALEE